MNHEFRLADIGEGLEEAEIIEWRVRVGDRVARDQTIVEVMTDKSNAELPAPVDGVVVSLGGSVGDMVEVGSVLAVIDASPIDASGVDPASSTTPTVSTFQVAAATAAPERAAALSESPEDAEPAEAASSAQDLVATPVAASEVYVAPRRPKASPTTRVEAARRGIDLATVTGTGPGGRILLTDLDRTDPGPVAPAGSLGGHTPSLHSDDAPSPDLASSDPVQEEPVQEEPVQDEPVQVEAIEPQASEAANDEPDLAGTSEPLRGVRRAIARNMAQSWSTIPHIHSFLHIDAEPMLELRDQLRASGRAEFAALTPLSFFVAAVADAVAENPIANASLDLESETITHHAAINIGVAVAAPQGLVVPVINNAGDRSLASVATAVREAVDGARSGSLSPEAFRGGTTTITNFGSLGGERALPLIRPPESSIFGFGSIALRPFVVDNEVVARKTMHLVIATDHRLLDGDVTTALLARVGSLLENPINLVLGD